ncbi:hypothetical protein F8M41_000682 [Gigaspora margarita]|uniref:Uncharacterized protein n=1 Tax=Gigaspora margarita TaxID=4874 RepID=A0A8H3XFM5_GIGMA|nr:hypothetical protein F8M41_000682 [Gigaspora margarita]
MTLDVILISPCIGTNILRYAPDQHIISNKVIRELTERKKARLSSTVNNYSSNFNKDSNLLLVTIVLVMQDSNSTENDDSKQNSKSVSDSDNSDSDNNDFDDESKDAQTLVPLHLIKTKIGGQRKQKLSLSLRNHLFPKNIRKTSRTKKMMVLLDWVIQLIMKLDTPKEDH